jgi:hypothetical protein
VDLDGTLARDDERFEEGRIGTPIMSMVWRIQDWLDQGKVVKIMTARVGFHPRRSLSIEDTTKNIQDWCEENIREGWRPEVTNQKDYAMLELWDDRAVRVVRNFGEACCDHTRQ